MRNGPITLHQESIFCIRSSWGPDWVGMKGGPYEDSEQAQVESERREIVGRAAVCVY